MRLAYFQFHLLFTNICDAFSPPFEDQACGKSPRIFSTRESAPRSSGAEGLTPGRAWVTLTSVDRRIFLQGAAAAPLLASPADEPTYRVVSAYKPAAQPGMPGPYPGQVVRVHSANSIDAASGKVNRELVKQMLAGGMKALTGDARTEDAWARFISPKDAVGIKVNCSGAPKIYSAPEVVAGIAENLIAAGVPAKQIWVYERFDNQLQSVGYAKYLPAGVNIFAVETSRSSILNYDPKTYVETSFFGEDDTRSNLARLVSETLTKIVNVPNLKEHQASGVTGCLKNIAYGNFSNVARSHNSEKTHTRTFIGTLANVEPVRSRVVLNIMDGLTGVWHGGPFSDMAQFRFYPKQLMFGTDPVAMDHKLIEAIEEKRKAEGAVSIFDRSMSHVGKDNSHPNTNHYIREPGHVEYASTLGLGVFDAARIKLKVIEL